VNKSLLDDEMLAHSQITQRAGRWWRWINPHKKGQAQAY
jgi:hypothetical protein